MEQVLRHGCRQPGDTRGLLFLHRATPRSWCITKTVGAAAARRRDESQSLCAMRVDPARMPLCARQRALQCSCSSCQRRALPLDQK